MRFGNDEHLLDLAAVVAGAKPAALIDPSYLQSPLGKLLTRRAIGKGMTVKIIPVFVGHSAVVGKPTNTARLETLYRNAKDTEKFHTEVGRALGYTEEAIADFLQRAGFRRIEFRKPN